MNKRLIIGITGASGIIYGIRLLEFLKEFNIETHLIISKAARLTLHHETLLSIDDIKKLASVYHPIQDVSASIASGSFKTMGMIIAPCSMKTLGEIAHSIPGNLISRAADVVLKERRRLVIMPREAPLHLGHLQNMLNITQMGGIIYPPTPAFYLKPENIDELVNDTVARVLELFDIESKYLRRWQ